METNFIISLTTLPNRSANINDVLLSLCSQNYDNYEVHLNVPKQTEFDGSYNIDFPFIKHDKLKIFYVDDVGAITKIYYTLKRTYSPSQRIISVDDDFIYSPDMLSIYNYSIQHLPDAVLGFAGIYPIGLESNGDLNCIGCLEPGNYCEVGILEGYKSICYRRDFFDDEFFDKWYKVHYNDDLTISSWLGYKNILKLCISYPYETDCVNRMLSFPLVNQVYNPISGVYHHREVEGGSQVSYKKFYNSELGIYIK